MTKRTLLFSTLCTFSVMLVACSTATAPTPQQPTSGMPVPGSTVDETEVKDDGELESTESTGVNVDVTAGVDAGLTARIVAVDVDNFTFAPNAITAKKGENVTVRLTGVDGSHGFAIPELGVNAAVAAGASVDVTLPTDRTGTFTFLCSVPCGSGHKDMNGTITITE